MHLLYKRFSIIGGFVILAVVLIANVLITRQLLDVQAGDQNGTAHSEKVLLQLSLTRLLLADAETGQRGFLSTGDTKYLEPYNRASAQLEPKIDELVELTADNPAEHKQIDMLRTLSEQKMSLLAQTISLYRAGYQPFSKDREVSESGRIVMDRIRKLMDEMARDETSLQVGRSKAYQKSVRRTIASIYFDTGLVLLCLLFLTGYILDQIQLRDRHTVQILEREGWFRSILTSLGEGVIATDKEGLITFLNPSAERLMGVTLTQAQGQPVDSVFPLFNEETRDYVANAIKETARTGVSSYPTHQSVMQRKDGVLIRIEDSASPIFDIHAINVGGVLVFRDATNERRSHELLRKTEMLAATARIASSVSSEIDAHQEAVGSLIYIVKTNGGVSTASSELLGLAEKELARATHITRQVLGFYRDYSSPRPVDLCKLLESTLESCASRFAEQGITVDRQIRDCPPIIGLSTELEQVISNLLSNAADASPYGTTIRVELACLDSAEGETVMLSVQDNGSGIAPADRGRIFEPFFTTKEGAAGLSLWVSKGIVERHGGKIQLLSDSNVESPCTVFNILLPVGTGVFDPYEPDNELLVRQQA